MFQIESKIRDLKYFKMLLDAGEQTHFFCCVPRDFKDFDKFEKKLERYDEKILEETLKPFVPSGHAFVCFDSTRSIESCEKYFKVSMMDYVRYGCSILGRNIITCCGYFTDQTRQRSMSTLGKFQSQIEDIELEEQYKNAVLMINKSTEPTDI